MSVELEWSAVTSNQNNKVTYQLQCTTKTKYFKSAPGMIQDLGTYESNKATNIVLAPEEYFFRVRALTNEGTEETASPWISEYANVKVGLKPAPPTTYSSVNSIKSGKDVTLFWTHNTKDGSKQQEAELDIWVDPNIRKPIIVKDDKSYYEVHTAVEYYTAEKIYWRVRTKGYSDEWSDWSVTRNISVYPEPRLVMNIFSKLNDIELVNDDITYKWIPVADDVTEKGGVLISDEQIDNYPIYISLSVGPDGQKPINYTISIAALDSYTTIDAVGNEYVVNEGEVLYSENFDERGEKEIVDNGTVYHLTKKIKANDIRFENNIRYRVDASVTMNSGLSANTFGFFTVHFSDDGYYPTAAVALTDDYCAYITPSCLDYDTDPNGVLVENVILSVYRIETNGTFTEIAKNLPNKRSLAVTDPHPLLTSISYRIVSQNTLSGSLRYFDTPARSFDSRPAIIQWDEEWIERFRTTNPDSFEDSLWNGCIVKLPYNIDVSYSSDPEVASIEYAGRENAVTYYGTHINVKQNWSVVIPKSDTDTLYKLRQLQRYLGDVYVREPSGTGFWATITVNMNISHRVTTIPVSISITKVEGGI